MSEMRIASPEATEKSPRTVAGDIISNAVQFAAIISPLHYRSPGGYSSAPTSKEENIVRSVEAAAESKKSGAVPLFSADHAESMRIARKPEQKISDETDSYGKKIIWAMFKEMTKAMPGGRHDGIRAESISDLLRIMNNLVSEGNVVEELLPDIPVQEKQALAYNQISASGNVAAILDAQRQAVGVQLKLAEGVAVNFNLSGVVNPGRRCWVTAYFYPEAQS